MNWCPCRCGVFRAEPFKPGEHAKNCFGKCCAKREADKK